MRRINDTNFDDLPSVELLPTEGCDQIDPSGMDCNKSLSNENQNPDFNIQNDSENSSTPNYDLPALDFKKAERVTAIIRNIATLQVHKHDAAQAQCDILCLSEIDLPDYQMRSC